MVSLATALLMLALGAVCLVAFVASMAAVRAQRALAEQRVAAEIGTRIGRHGLWVGAWLVAIPAERARQVRDEARSEAGKRAPPERILELWRSAGAQLLAHLPGPEVTTEAEACGWLEHTAGELAQAPISPLAAGDRRSLFALVYACTEPPPGRAAGWSELRDRLLGPACVGVAFVACLEGAAGGADRRVPLAAIGGAKWALLAAGVAGLTGGGVALVLAPRDEPAAVGAGSPEAKAATAAAAKREAAAANAPAAASGAAASGAPAISAAAAGPTANAAASASDGGATEPDGGAASGAAPGSPLPATPSATAPEATATALAPAALAPTTTKSEPGGGNPKSSTLPAGASPPATAASQTSTGTHAP